MGLAEPAISRRLEVSREEGRVDDCRFDNCTHTHEPGCAVRAAVARGAVSAARYESYVAMLNDED